jgi:large subunit ribosomal protein L18
MAYTRKIRARLKRKQHIRQRIQGTAQRPRLTVYRSVKHIYAQVVDDTSGRTLAAASSLEADVRGGGEKGKKSELAKRVGTLVARRCLEKSVDQVVFDRNGFVYHGRVAKVAEGAREAGLKL